MAAPKRITREEYLAAEEKASSKHEFVDGQIVAMAFGTAAHSLIAVNLLAAVHTHLRGRSCLVLNSDLRVALASGNVVYPDLTVTCEPMTHPSPIEKPTLVVEVLSPSTEAFDRGRKFQLYAATESIQEIVFVSQTSRRVEVFRRVDEGWLLTIAEGEGATMHLRSVNLDVALVEIYRDFELTPEPTEIPAESLPASHP